MNKYYVYKHLKKGTDEVFYIGKGSGNRAYYKTQRNKLWNNIVNKYGYDIEIVEDNLSEETAFNLEIKLIKKYGRRDFKLGTLCNMSNGGEGDSGKIISIETKKKMSEWQKGVPKSEIFKNKLRGKKHSEETKKKISNSNKGIKKGYQKHSTNSKYVLNLETGIYYDSCKQAADYNNINYNNLKAYLNGTVKNRTNLIYA